MTVRKLKDVAGGPQLIKTLVDSASDMALAFVGEDVDKVREHLERGRKGFEEKLAKEIGPRTARALVDCLFRAVLGEKARLEASRPGGFLKN